MNAIRRKYDVVRALRAEIVERIGIRSDILGAMIGAKLCNGEITAEIGITCFVREKVPIQELSPKQRIPRSILIGRKRIITDVLTWSPMVEQTLADPMILSDGHHQGTLTCFAKSDNGMYGVTCAHCLVGADNSQATSKTISLFSRPPGEFVEAGKSVYMVSAPGTGAAGDFGYLDCGIFDLQEASFQELALSVAHLAIALDDQVIPGQQLKATSALQVPGFSDQTRTATILGVELDVEGERSDFVLSVNPPGTFHGDSGMLWRTLDGRAAAIHARGESMPPGQGSRIASAMSAARAVKALCVEFLG